MTLASDEALQLTGARMPTMQANGATIAYTDTGAPDGRPDAPTIVFGHGLLFSGWMFHAQVEALQDRFRCVTIDWRGQGATPATADGYDMDTLSRDAIALIEQLGVGPVHYVGLSMGGFIGQRIGARRGDLLRTLTLLDTSPDPEEPKAARQDRLLSVVYRLVGMRLIVGQVLPIMFGPTFRADPNRKAVIDPWLDTIATCDRSGMRKAVLGVANRDGTYDEIDKIAVPTLMIVGADDVPTPVAKARRIVDRIPGARLEIVSDAGHSSPVEQPEAITKLLTEFLS